MDVSGYVEQLQRQLLTAGAGSAETEEIAARLATALDAAARLAILEALSDAAGEISRSLAPGSVDVRLRGREVEFVVSPAVGPRDGGPDGADTATEPAAATAATAAEENEDSATARITLRLPESLKTRAEAAAGSQGISLNTWLVRTVAVALEPARTASRSHGSSFTGWLR